MALENHLAASSAASHRAAHKSHANHRSTENIGMQNERQRRIGECISRGNFNRRHFVIINRVLLTPNETATFLFDFSFILKQRNYIIIHHNIQGAFFPMEHTWRVCWTS